MDTRRAVTTAPSVSCVQAATRVGLKVVGHASGEALGRNVAWYCSFIFQFSVFVIQLNIQEIQLNSQKI
jgi:hypothetical protein